MQAWKRKLLRLKGLDPDKHKIHIYETNIKDGSGLRKIRTNTFDREIIEGTPEKYLDWNHFNSKTSLHLKRFLESQLPSIVPLKYYQYFLELTLPCKDPKDEEAFEYLWDYVAKQTQIYCKSNNINLNKFPFNACVIITLLDSVCHYKACRAQYYVYKFLYSQYCKYFIESNGTILIPHLYAILLYCLLNYQIGEPATVSLLKEKQIFSNWKDATIFISEYFLPYFEDNIQQRLILFAKQLKWGLKFGETRKILTKKQINYNYYYRKYFNKSVNMMGYVWTAFSDKVYEEISLINAKDFSKVSFKMLIQPSSIYCMDVIVLESTKCANAKNRSLTVTSRIFCNFWGYRSLSYLYRRNIDDYFTQSNKYLKATNNRQRFEQLRVIVRRARTMLFRWVCSQLHITYTTISCYLHYIFSIFMHVYLFTLFWCM